MVIYREDTNKKEVGDFFARFSLRNQLQDFSFTGGQRVRFKNDLGIPFHYLDHVIDDLIREIRRDVRLARPNRGVDPALGEEVSREIREAGVGFMMAPSHHGAMKHVGAVRQALGTRTIFNLLGPLSNPASVRRQMIGVFSRQWIEPMAQVLKNLGSETVWVAHGSDGLDEITTSGPTHVAALEDGKVRTFEINPEDAGLHRAKPEQLRGGDADTNAAALMSVLKGNKGPYRDIAILNAAAALVVAGRAKDLKGGAIMAAKSLDSGEAEGRLDRLIAVSNAPGL